MKNKRNILIIAVIALTLFTLLITSLKDFLVSNQKVQGNITGSTAGTTQYFDWSGLSSIDSEYSYSTLFYTKSTKIYVNTNEDDQIQYGTRILEDNTPTPEMTFTKSSGKGQIIITDCAVDKEGNLLSAVFDVSPQSLWESDSSITFKFQKHGINAGKEDPDFINYSQMNIGYNMPFHFRLVTKKASAKIKLTYYKNLTLKNIQNSKYTTKATDADEDGKSLNYAQVDSSKSTIATNITKVNSYYDDMDITRLTESGKLFDGKEGVSPINGTSRIYYNKGNTTFSNDVLGSITIKLSESENGLFADVNTANEAIDTMTDEQKAEIGSGNMEGSWYGDSTEFLTDNLAGSYSFVYSGVNCGLGFMFFSPKEYDINPPVKKVSKEEVSVGETFYYTISQYIPNNYFSNILDFSEIYPNFSSDSFISKLQFYDNFDERLTIDSNNITIKDINGNDLSQYFTVSVNNNILTTTEKPAASQYYKKPEFYNNIITITVPAKYIQKPESVIEIPNLADTVTKIGTGVDKTQYTEEVKVKIRPLKLVYDCTTNGGEPKFNPITYFKTEGEKVSVSTTDYACTKPNHRHIGWAEQPTDSKDKVLTSFTMPGHDTILYALYEPITCDLTLTSDVYKINEEAATVNVPKNHTNDEILKNIKYTGEATIENDQIKLTCNGNVKIYKISRYWIAQTGQKVIKYTAIIIGLIILIGGLIFLNKKWIIVKSKK